MASKKRRRRSKRKPMIFSPWNYKVMAIGILMVVAGFSAMYIENEVQGFISLYISPLIIMGGYVAVIIAILKHDNNSSAATDESQEG